MYICKLNFLSYSFETFLHLDLEQTQILQLILKLFDSSSLPIIRPPTMNQKQSFEKLKLGNTIIWGQNSLHALLPWDPDSDVGSCKIDNVFSRLSKPKMNRIRSIENRFRCSNLMLHKELKLLLGLSWYLYYLNFQKRKWQTSDSAKISHTKSFETAEKRAVRYLLSFKFNALWSHTTYTI